MEVRIIPIRIDTDVKDMDEFMEILVRKLEGVAEDGDVIVIASKILLKAKGLYIDLDEIEASKEAARLAEKYSLDPRFAELILKYSDEVLGGVDGVVLTYAGKVLSANAGLDRKNIGVGRVSLPPYLLTGTSKDIHDFLRDRLNVEVGVIITDSVVYPLRMGTRLYAVDVYGFNPIKDYRGEKDVYGRTIVFTSMNLADEISSAAHLVMGEGREKTPAALVKGLDIEPLHKDVTTMLRISPDKCLYKDLYPEKLRRISKQ